MNETHEQQYEMSLLLQEMARSLEKEVEIYNTPCADEGNYGPIYCEPPSDEHKIYAKFEGTKFRKLHHKEIRLAAKHVKHVAIPHSYVFYTICVWYSYSYHIYVWKGHLYHCIQYIPYEYGYTVYVSEKSHMHTIHISLYII